MPTPANLYLATVQFPYFTGLPSDVVENTFHFTFSGGGTPDVTDFEALEAVLRGLYADIFDDGSTASMAPWMRPGTTTVKMYHVADPVPRTPVYMNTSSFAVVQSVNAPMPTEVALCLSYEGAHISGADQASRRGRIYIGGLGNVVSQGDNGTFPLPTANILANIAAAAPTLITNAALVSWNWVVYSRKNDATVPIQGGWVDNAFDTQRRRGQAPSARTAWTA